MGHVIDIDRRDFIARVQGGGCRLCRSHINLEFHHIHPEDKEFSIGKNMPFPTTKGWLVELNKCITVCRSCHRSIHGYGSPPKQIPPKRRAAFLQLQEWAKDPVYVYYRNIALKHINTSPYTDEAIRRYKRPKLI